MDIMTFQLLNERHIDELFLDVTKNNDEIFLIFLFFDYDTTQFYKPQNNISRTYIYNNQIYNLSYKTSNETFKFESLNLIEEATHL